MAKGNLHGIYQHRISKLETNISIEKEKFFSLFNNGALIAILSEIANRINDLKKSKGVLEQSVDLIEKESH